MHVFLTGASGFIGRNLVPYLQSRGCELTCLLRDPERLPEPLRSTVSVVVGDVTRPGTEVTRALSKADAVVHLAARLWSHTYAEYDIVNRQGSEQLVKVTADAAASLRRFLMVSSIAATGPALPGKPVTESTPSAPVSWYGQTKLAGEQALNGAPFPWTILRPPMVYGPHDRGIRQFFTLAAKHIRPQLHWGRMELSLIHVQDVCQAIWLVLSSEDRPHSSYLINDGQPIYRVSDVLKLVARAGNAWTVPLPLPAWLLRTVEWSLTAGQRLGWSPKGLAADKLREVRQTAWTCDSTLMASTLGFSPEIPLSIGIPALADWYRETGVL